MKTKHLGAQKNTVKKVLQAIKKYRLLLGLSLILAAVGVGLTLYVPILVGRAIDLMVGAGQVPIGQVVGILLQIGIVVAITSLALWGMNIINNKMTCNVVADIRDAAFAKIKILPLSYIDSHSYGEVVSRVITDVDQFSDGLLMGFTQLFTGVLTIVGTLIFMMRVNLAITGVVVVLTPVSLLVANFIAKRTYHMFVLQSKTRAEQTALIDEAISNQKLVQAFNQRQAMQNKFDLINQRLMDCSLKATFYSSLTNPSTRFVNGLVYAAVGLFGALAAMSGAITVGGLSCFLSYANQYTKPFNEISGVVSELQNALACGGRIFELIDETPQTPDPKDATQLTNLQGNVRLEQVCFSYTPGQKLIDQFDLCVQSGQRVAIVGPTGCGKTTLINLLMRFYDVDSGQILIDGQDVRHITRQSLRKSFGMMLQDTWLKSGTIAQNIAMGKPDATPQQIVQAAKACHAHSFIKRLPNGYDTQISENGESLSQGQRQLLCIARVMLTLPPMLILDEATSSIDTRTEQKIQQAFAKLMEGKTSFIVAHRLSTILQADIILAMRDGSIVEQGTHQQLLEKNGFYAQLWRSQFAQ